MNSQLQNRKRRNPWLIAGLVLLAVTNLSYFLVRRQEWAKGGEADLIHGLLIGLAIGLLITALVVGMKDQENRGGDKG